MERPGSDWEFFVGDNGLCLNVAGLRLTALGSSAAWFGGFCGSVEFSILYNESSCAFIFLQHIAVSYFFQCFSLVSRYLCTLLINRTCSITMQFPNNDIYIHV